MVLLTDFQINIISFIPTFLFLFILLWQILRGAMRGGSKSFKLFINFSLSLLIAFIFYEIIARANIDEIACTTIEPKLPVSFKELLHTDNYHSTLTGYLEEYLSKNDIFIKASRGLSVTDTVQLLYLSARMILNSIVFILSFVVYFISKFFLYIIYLIFFREGRRKKKIDKAFAAGTRKTPYKKKRLQGCLFGLIRGLIMAGFALGFIGFFASIVTKPNTSNYITNNEEKKTSGTNRNIAEFYEIIQRYNTQGIGLVLNNVKFKDSAPLYMLIADKLTEADYTYTNENGEQVTLKLSLSDDLFPLTSSVSEIAYLFLVYGFDTQRVSDTQYLIDFLTSTDTIDGLTLEDRIKETILKTDINALHDLLNEFVITFASYYTNGVEENNTEEYLKLNISQRLVYQLFLGKHSLMFSDIVNAQNTANTYDILCKVLNNMEDLQKMSSAFISTESTTGSDVTSLSMVVNPNLTEEEARENVTTSKNIFSSINDSLKGYSFYTEDNFNYLVTDLVKTLISFQFPGFDMESSVDDRTLDDISWTDSLDSVFEFLDYAIGTAFSDDSIKTFKDLIDFYVVELENTESPSMQKLIKLFDCTALTIILNTKGFSELINERVSTYLSSVSNGSAILLVETNYGTYINKDGVKVKGELVKIMETIGPTVAKLYKASTNEDLDDNGKKEKIIELVTDPDTNIYDLIDTNSTNHSDLIHCLISDVISNTTIKTDDADIKLYRPIGTTTNLNLVTGVQHEVIVTSEFKTLLQLFHDLASNINEFTDGTLTTETYLDFLADTSNETIENMKHCNIVKANLSIILYHVLHNSVTVPSYLKLDYDLIDENINAWIIYDDTHTGEMIALMDIVKSSNTLIKEIVNGAETSSYVDKILKSNDEVVDSLLTSNIVDCTITSHIQGIEKIYVPYISYTDESREQIKSSELKALFMFVRKVNNVDPDSEEETEAIDISRTYETFNMNEYKNNVDGLIDLLSPNILSATVAYNMVTSSNDSSALIIPNSYVFNSDDETNLSKWLIENNNDSELEKILRGLEILDLLDKVTMNTITFNAESIKALTDEQIRTIVSSACMNASVIIFINDNLSGFIVKPTRYTVTREDLVSDYEHNIYVTEDETFKFISGLNVFNNDFTQANFSFDFVKSLTESQTNKLLNSDILYYSISSYLFDINSLDYAYSDKLTIDSEQYLAKTEINNLVACLKIIDANDYSDINSDVILQDNLDMDVLLNSNTMWLTISNKIFNLDTLSVPYLCVSEDSNSSDVFIFKTELKSFTTCFKSLTNNQTSLTNTINVDVSRVVDNYETLIESAIVRGIISKEILKYNQVVTKRLMDETHPFTDNRDERYAELSKDYTNYIKNNTDVDMVLINETELSNFVEAIKTIFGNNIPSDFNIDYSTLNILNINTSILDSSIFLTGLQTQISEAATNYNNVDPGYELRHFALKHFIYNESLNRDVIDPNYYSREDTLRLIAAVTGA